jgi:hypothetical protein
VAGRSTIDKLDPQIRLELDGALKRGATIDEITWMLKGLGADVSRSAVGRYSKQYADLASRQRDMQSIAKAFGAEFGQEGDLQGRLMIQLLTSLITRAAMPIAAGEAEELPDFKELHFLARAVKDATSAAKTDVDRFATGSTTSATWRGSSNGSATGAGGSPSRARASNRSSTSSSSFRSADPIASFRGRCSLGVRARRGGTAGEEEPRDLPARPRRAAWACPRAAASAS